MYNPSPFVLSDAQPKSETLKPNLSKEIYGFCLWKLHQALASLNDASRTPRVLIFLHHPTWRLLCPILRPWITHQTILFSWCRLSPLVPGSFVSLTPPEGIFSITDQRMTSYVPKLWRFLKKFCSIMFFCIVMIVLLLTLAKSDSLVLV